MAQSESESPACSGDSRKNQCADMELVACADDCSAVRVKCGVIQMAMGVDQHGSRVHPFRGAPEFDEYQTVD